MKYISIICVICLLVGCQPSEQKVDREISRSLESAGADEKSSDKTHQKSFENINPIPETNKAVAAEKEPEKPTISNEIYSDIQDLHSTAKSIEQPKILSMEEKETVAEVTKEDDISPITSVSDEKSSIQDNNKDLTNSVFTEIKDNSTEIKKEDDEQPVKPAIPDTPKTEPSKPANGTEDIEKTVKKTEDPGSGNSETEKKDGDKKPKRPEFYNKYNDILKKYVDKNGNVDYISLRRKRAELFDVIRSFEKIDISIEDLAKNPENEQISFWINAHNIFTLKLIVDNYPIKRNTWMTLMYPDIGIMHIPGARDKIYFDILSEERTLREIEKEILMDTFKDTRIPFALTYATVGGAFLRNESFYPEQLDKQLDEQVKRFLASSKGLKIDKSEDIVYLSDIFNWYEQYFIEQYSDIKKFRSYETDIRSYLNFIIKYIPKEDVEFLESNDFTVKFMKYEWKLNDQQF